MPVILKIPSIDQNVLKLHSTNAHIRESLSSTNKTLCFVFILIAYFNWEEIPPFFTNKGKNIVLSLSENKTS